MGWKGVRLSTVLKECGIKSKEEGARFVSFRGPLKELPKGKDGSYGTSIAYDRAMDDTWDVILAYQMNGEPLSPDHGSLFVLSSLASSVDAWSNGLKTSKLPRRNPT